MDKLLMIGLFCLLVFGMSQGESHGASVCNSCHIQAPNVINHTDDFDIACESCHQDTPYRSTIITVSEKLFDTSSIYNGIYKVCIDNRLYILAAGKFENNLTQVLEKKPNYMYLRHVECR